ncbi:MAG: twin-arginine translocase TatA/TatE family subunit [Bacteroidetes bacterium]|uniref:Sec-independent protein translocase protein TatA n=1 Tax=Candidatus Merdivivens pullicola TaxID=2840872 RepID=A0A9D9IH83_9BACT|nr:twin-arginine translocase TatA/TatE family subunit [Candidatus Merdivivens pullicola]
MDILIATPLFLGGIGLPEILVILVIILLFFGAKKIPELMKGLGKGVKSFKEGMNEVTKDLDTPSDKDTKDGGQDTKAD